MSYDDDGQLDMSTIVPMVDGGTEGFKGNARVIIPGISACVECTLDLYPPQVSNILCFLPATTVSRSYWNSTADTKCAYFAKFGLTVYFQQLLKDRLVVTSGPFFTIHFFHSLCRK